jgi:hypothetical protein
MENKKLNEAALLINQKIYPFYTRVTKKELMFPQQLSRENKNCIQKVYNM